MTKLVYVPFFSDVYGKRKKNHLHSLVAKLLQEQIFFFVHF